MLLQIFFLEMSPKCMHLISGETGEKTVGEKKTRCSFLDQSLKVYTNN